MDHLKIQEFWDLRRRYLFVYGLVVAADWLQGSHVYALYESYGISSRDIALLFVMGFGSSLLLGTVVASFGDKLGRRNVCIAYGVIYGLSCLTKHSPNLWILMGGRLLAGIATSIMCTSFEAWLVCECNKKGLSIAQLGDILSGATKLNGIIAILSGVVAQFAVNTSGKLVSPFDVAAGILTVTSILVYYLWTENYGDQNAPHLQPFASGVKTLLADTNVLLVGLIQSLFEGSMYIFVLLWTPALEVKSKDHIEKAGEPKNILLPHGYIFSAFMIAVALGSFLFSCLSRRLSLERILMGLLIISTLTFVPALAIPEDAWAVFAGFVIFEFCVGVFWPCMGALRGRYVPEDCRSTLMNYFRIPVNLVVVVVLVQDASLWINFLCCLIFLAACAVLPTRFKPIKVSNIDEEMDAGNDVSLLSAKEPL
ncbi:molybdate-anion transporter-like isoform X2 [Paramacrobiotus metropolitanus]|uniref:molybdate-anion transporter-like isoform X2 n=1 Tax=Paramacrobiotus metropolitanus TaxID=2943436 RepID=UPI0024465139|nr:molybdate-anion transporter-like isoform X2 [Paramacrobiotus metropolitanus]